MINFSEGGLYEENLHYIAPEILGKKNDFTKEDRKKIDQYMLGMLGYELLVGKIEMAASNFDELKARYQDVIQNLPSLAKVRQNCPSGLSDIIHKMLSIDPEERYPSMEKAVQVLSEVTFDDIEIAQDSYKRCLASKRNNTSFIEAFYEAFIAVSLQAKEKFGTLETRTKQYEKLTVSILHLFSFAKQNEEPRNTKEPNVLTLIAKQHKAQGICSHSYDEFKRALMATVCEFDEHCTSNTLNNKILKAWEFVLARGINYMKEKTPGEATA